MIENFRIFRKTPRKGDGNIYRKMTTNSSLKLKTALAILVVVVSAMTVLFVLHSEADNSSADASDMGQCGPNAHYHYWPGNVLVIDGHGEMYDYTSAHAPWYDYRGDIAKVVISDSITYIGAWAFAECTNIKELSIPISLNSVTSDTYCAFAGCCNIEKVTFTAGYGYDYAAHAGNDAWYQNTPWYQSRDALKEIVFADGVKHIGADAFRELNITSVVLPDSVTSLGCHCFFGCTGLTSLTIPISLNSYGDEAYPAFEGCKEIKNVTFTRGNGVPFDYSDCLHMPYYVKLAPWNAYSDVTKKIVISDDIVLLGEHMFYNCNIESLTIPMINFADFQNMNSFKAPYDSLKEVTITKGIGVGHDYENHLKNSYIPWNNAENLETIVLEEGITYVGQYTFNTVNVNSLVIPDSVTAIGGCGFAYCNIKCLTLPISLNAAGTYCSPFSGVTGIEKVIFTAGNGNGCDYSAHESDFTWYQNTPWYKCRSTLEDIVFEDGIKHIGADAFRELNILSVEIPDSVESLGCHTFYQCKELMLIILPISLDSVCSAKYPAFEGCTSIVAVRLTAGNGVGFDYGADYLPVWCTQSIHVMSFDSGIRYVGEHTFDGYTFFGKDGKELEPVSADLGGHIFAGTDNAMYQADCGSDVPASAVMSDPVLVLIFTWRW